MMWVAVRRVRLLWLCSVGLCCCLALGCAGAPAHAQGDAPVGGELAGSLLTGGLVVLGSPSEGEQLGAQRKARLESPVAVAEREASRTRFEHLGDKQAREEAALAFPGMIGEPAGGPPRLSAGERIVGYPTDHAAQVVLADGKHALIESTEAIAVETSAGRREPVDLSLNEVGDGFEPRRPRAGAIVIPKHLSAGVALQALNVSLTPVDPQGLPLSGAEGVLDGASVVYANTQTDSDTVAKPTSGGFELDSLLRSARSPEQLYFHVGLPQGASLVGSGAGAGIRIMKDGELIARIPSPGATDAAGTPVPVTMTVKGDTVVVKADLSSGEHQYPVAVDPGIITEWAGEHFPANWHFIHSGSAFTDEVSGGGDNWAEHIAASHKVGEWGAWAYTTQGDSYITKAGMNLTSDEPKGNHIENLLELVSPAGVAETKTEIPTEANGRRGISSNYERGLLPGYENSVEYLQESNGEGAGGEASASQEEVTIDQETEAECYFNTTSPTVDGQPNVMYGTGNWLGPHSGAVELVAADQGIGISPWGLEYQKPEEEYKSLEVKDLLYEGLCIGGVQCPEKVREYMKYSPLFASGEVEIGVSAENAILWGRGTTEPESEHRHMIKVDATPPSGIAISGLESGDEIGEGEYTLKAEATDSQSGVKAIAVTVDGRELGKPNGSCPLGPCTAKGEWQVNGAEFGAGEHKLQVTATDNAGNVSPPQEFTFKVHHATPVALGPGTVNPQSGEFTLSANDVALAAPGSGLEVVRSYGSRHV